MTLVFAAVGLPKENIAMLLTVDWFLDRCRTAINVMGETNISCLLDGKTRNRGRARWPRRQGATDRGADCEQDGNLGRAVDFALVGCRPGKGLEISRGAPSSSRPRPAPSSRIVDKNELPTRLMNCAKDATADDHRDDRDDASAGRDRAQVAVADRGEGDQRPPDRIGQPCELLGLRIVLEFVDRHGTEHHDHDHDEAHDGQLVFDLAKAVHHVLQRWL